MQELWHSTLGMKHHEWAKLRHHCGILLSVSSDLNSSLQMKIKIKRKLLLRLQVLFKMTAVLKLAQVSATYIYAQYVTVFPRGPVRIISY